MPWSAPVTRGSRCNAELASGLPDVLIDKIQIHQVIINLIRNSIDALAETDGQRTIVLQTRRADLTKSRSRSPIPAQVLPTRVKSRLFQPFVTTKADGMGIGLSICRTIVDGHGGRIWASDQPGGGTAFHFTLPAADDDGR